MIAHVVERRVVERLEVFPDAFDFATKQLFTCLYELGEFAVLGRELCLVDDFLVSGHHDFARETILVIRVALDFS